MKAEASEFGGNLLEPVARFAGGPFEEPAGEGRMVADKRAIHQQRQRRLTRSGERPEHILRDQCDITRAL